MDPRQVGMSKSWGLNKILQANGNKLDSTITIGIMTPAYFMGKPWLCMNVHMMCMIVLCINKQMDSHIGLPIFDKPFCSRLS